MRRVFYLATVVLEGMAILACGLIPLVAWEVVR